MKSFTDFITEVQLIGYKMAVPHYTQAPKMKIPKGKALPKRSPSSARGGHGGGHGGHGGPGGHGGGGAAGASGAAGNGGNGGGGNGGGGNGD
jgi:hypothetical protein